MSLRKFKEWLFGTPSKPDNPPAQPKKKPVRRETPSTAFPVQRESWSRANRRFAQQDFDDDLDAGMYD